jgi:hypothetical protein
LCPKYCIFEDLRHGISTMSGLVKTVDKIVYFYYYINIADYFIYEYDGENTLLEMPDIVKR